MGCGASKQNQDNTASRDNQQQGEVKEKTDSPANKETPKILIAGPPAGGKGTQCEGIVSNFGVTHISTGDLLRAEVKAGSEEGKQADECMKNGALVPDEIIIKMVQKRLEQEDVQKNGWLLDGFPRTKSQAEALQAAGIAPQIMILLEVPDDVLVERVEGRRSDPVTGAIYHLKFNPPPEDEEIKNRLEHRADDTEEAIVKRVESYHNNVNAILEFYTDVLVKIDGNRDKAAIGADVKAAIENRGNLGKKEEEAPAAAAAEEPKKEEEAPAPAPVPADEPAAEEKKEEEPKKDDGKKTIWDELRVKLPTDKKDSEQRKRRKELFSQFDPNGNGYLSLAEVDKGAREVFQLDKLTDDLAPILMRAFTAAKGVRQKKGKGKKFGEDYVEKAEFRLLLLYIKQYFELWFMFDEIDTSDDRRINPEEFKKCVAQIENWGVKIEDPDAAFKEIDTNDGGIILFKEFSDWAIAKGLDLEDDATSDDE